MGSGHATAIASGTGNAIWAGVPGQKEGKLQETDSDIGGLLRLAGICDIDPARVDWARERGYRIYDTYQDILDDPNVDIVLIATPNHLHKEEAISAMRAGKDIEELQSQCDKEDNRAFCKDQFLKAVRKFMEMKTLTPTILHELVDMPEVEEYPDNVVLDSRQGVAVEYLVGKAG